MKIIYESGGIAILALITSFLVEYIFSRAPSEIQRQWTLETTIWKGPMGKGKDVTQGTDGSMK